MERRHHPVLEVEDVRAGGLHAVLHLEQELFAGAVVGVGGQAAGLCVCCVGRVFWGAGWIGTGMMGGGSFSSTDDRSSAYPPSNNKPRKRRTM